MFYGGIDPGAKGSICVIDENNKIMYLNTMSEKNLIMCFSVFKEKDIIVCVEKVGAMPGQGVTSMFNFGKSAGFIEGVLSAYFIPYQLVSPKTWKKEFSLIHKEKSDSIRVCKQLFPDINLLPTPRCTKESDGMAEATLMAVYAKRRMK